MIFLDLAIWFALIALVALLWGVEDLLSKILAELRLMNGEPDDPDDGERVYDLTPAGAGEAEGHVALRVVDPLDGRLLKELAAVKERPRKRG